MGQTCRVLLVSLAGCLAAISIAACSSPAARHKVLTFFFTGVPPEGATQDEQTATQPAAAQVVSRQSLVVVSSRFGHGPYAASACYQCHETSASGGLRGIGKKEAAKSALAQSANMSGKLLAPVPELCSGCHEGTSPAEAVKAGLWVHGPVSTGLCTECHNPHAGPEQYMLEKRTDALCVDCHSAGMIVNRPEHQDRTDCVTCHSVHVSRDSRLLTADYRDAW